MSSVINIVVTCPSPLPPQIKGKSETICRVKDFSCSFSLSKLEIIHLSAWEESQIIFIINDHQIGPKKRNKSVFPKRFAQILQRVTSKRAWFGGRAGERERGKASVNLKSTGHFNLDCKLCKCSCDFLFACQWLED